MPRKTAAQKKAEEEAATAEAATTEPEGDPKNTETTGPDAPLTDEDWAKARADLIASLPEEKDRPKNIYGRLAQILGFIHQIRKSGWNAFHKYKYAKESDIVEAVRPILSEYGILLEQGIAHDPNRDIVGVTRLSKTLRDRDRNIVGVSEDITQVMIESRFVWWNPEAKQLENTEPKLWAGYGDDAGDKGIYKALTGAAKYMIMKTFLISTGDDPEGDENTDRRAAAAQASRPVTVERGGSQGRRPPAAGGKQAEGTEPARKVLKELLVKSGAKNAKDIIAKLESIVPELKVLVEDDDYAAAVVKLMATIPGPTLGLAIRKLREELGEPEATVSPVRSEAEEAQLVADGAAIAATAAEAVGTIQPGGQPADASEAEGWENEDPEGTDASSAPAPDEPAGVLEGDEAAAV